MAHDTLRDRYAAAVRDAASRAASESLVYGATDCLLFLADVVKTVTGRDPASDYRGRYADRAGAYALMGKRGVAGMLAKVAKAHGWPRIEPKDAKPGDIGFLMTPEGPAGAIFSGEFWFGRDEFGIAAWRTEMNGRCLVKRAWSVV